MEQSFSQAILQKEQEKLPLICSMAATLIAASYFAGANIIHADGVKEAYKIYDEAVKEQESRIMKALTDEGKRRRGY